MPYVRTLVGTVRALPACVRKIPASVHWLPETVQELPAGCSAGHPHRNPPAKRSKSLPKSAPKPASEATCLASRARTRQCFANCPGSTRSQTAPEHSSVQTFPGVEAIQKVEQLSICPRSTCPVPRCADDARANDTTSSANPSHIRPDAGGHIVRHGHSRFDPRAAFAS